MTNSLLTRSGNGNGGRALWGRAIRVFGLDMGPERARRVVCRRDACACYGGARTVRRGSARAPLRGSTRRVRRGSTRRVRCCWGRGAMCSTSERGATVGWGTTARGASWKVLDRGRWSGRGSAGRGPPLIQEKIDEDAGHADIRPDGKREFRPTLVVFEVPTDGKEEGAGHEVSDTDGKDDMGD